MSKEYGMKRRLLQQKYIASVMEAEQEYAHTGEAIDFEDMMAEFSEEFNWNC
jgi:hypothetical protein